MSSSFEGETRMSRQTWQAVIRPYPWLILFTTILLWVSCTCRVEAAAKNASPGPGSSQGARQGAPSIQVSENAFDFGEVMEGSEVIHAFTVKNEGSEVLRIEQVRPGCGCTAAQFDRTFSAGGEGKITLRLDTTGYEGTVKKAATVHSNDPEQPRLILTLQGVVKTFIEVRPSSSVTFRGPADQQSPKAVELVGSKPFHIQKVESSLEGKVSHEIEPMDAERGYRLSIRNISKQGTYAGSIKVRTDLPEKSQVLIRVSGTIEGDIAVRPQTIMIGRIAADQPPRQGVISVVTNRAKPFKITKLTYDERLIKVAQKPLDQEHGYVLEISPILENVPAGSREKRTLSIQTDEAGSMPYDVQVYLFNSTASSPPATNVRPPGLDEK
jgi:hypothetical protein